MLHPQQIVSRRLQRKLGVSKYHPHQIKLTNVNNNSNTTHPNSDFKKKVTTNFSGCFRRTTSNEDILDMKEPKARHKTKKRSFLWSDKKTKEPAAKVSLLEYYEDEVGGEKVIINKHHLYNTDDGKETTIVIRDYLTPVNFSKTVEYYSQISKARETYLRAALVAGDYLQHGQCQGDKTEWIEYLKRQEVERKLWRRKCVEDDKTAKHYEENFSYLKLCKKFCRRIWKYCLNECIDIFPCCFPE